MSKYNGGWKKANIPTSSVSDSQLSVSFLILTVCHDDLITPDVSYLGDMKLIMKSKDTVQIIQNKLKSKSSMQFEQFSVGPNGKFEAKGNLHSKKKQTNSNAEI